MLYKARNKPIKFYDDYFLMMSEAKYSATKGKGRKILTPEQMLQRLPIALAQVKAGNNSESLLMKSNKLLILCINQKKSPKKYTITLLSQYKDGHYIYDFRKL